jgi:hypothetical protein
LARFFVRFLLGCNVFGLKGSWEQPVEEQAVKKARKFYKMGLQCPLFHPHCVSKDGSKYQMINEPSVDALIASYKPSDFKTPFAIGGREGEIKDLKEHMFFKIKANGDTVKKDGPHDVVGVVIQSYLSMLSVMGHVDTLHSSSMGETEVEKLSPHEEKAMMYLCHNGLSKINHRKNLRLRHANIHNRERTRDDAREGPVDLVTTCLGFTPKIQKFANSFVVTPMEVTKSKLGEDARIMAYEALEGADDFLERQEYLQEVSFDTLSDLYSIVVDRQSKTLLEVIKELTEYQPAFQEDADQAQKGKALLRVTNFVLQSLSLRFGHFQKWEDFVNFGLRLYHLDPDITQHGGDVAFPPKWAGIWYQMDELVYFLRIMFNKMFKFRIPNVDGATKKFASDMALMRLKPIRTVAEAAQKEKYVFLAKGDECDEHNFIASIITYPVSLELVIPANREYLPTAKQSSMWVKYSLRKQQTDVKISSSSLREIALNVIDMQSNRPDSILDNWPVTDTTPDKNFLYDRLSTFRRLLITEITSCSGIESLLAQYSKNSPEITRMGKEEQTAKLIEHFADSKSKLFINRWNADERCRTVSLLPLTFLCQFVIHPEVSSQDYPNFDGTQHQIVANYITRNGIEAPFWYEMNYMTSHERDGEEDADGEEVERDGGEDADGKEVSNPKSKPLYQRGRFCGNFPQDDSLAWDPHVDWANGVLRRYVGFFTAAGTQLLEHQHQLGGATVAQLQASRIADLSKQIIYSTAVVDFMEAVNLFGHQIPVPLQWGESFPKLAEWMKPKDWIGHHQNESNIPQGLALLTILAMRSLNRNVSNQLIPGVTKEKLPQMEPEDRQGIRFNSTWLNLLDDPELFPESKKKEHRTFDPKYLTFARVQFALKTASLDVREVHSATRML